MATALAIRDSIEEWALRHGILSTSAGPRGADDGADVTLVPFSPQHADYFRTRHIVRVTATKSPSSSVTIFSSQKIARSKEAEMRKVFSEVYGDKIELRFDVSKPFRIDQAVQEYGRFEPILKHGGLIACGSSVGLGNQRNAGTLTALARGKRSDKGLYGISCNHVVGGCNTARPGTPIVVPGIQDVSSDHPDITVIGYHARAAAMSQGLPGVFDITRNHDIACFAVNDEAGLTSIQGYGDEAYDTPSSFIDDPPQRGLQVKKWGRSTGFTRGEVDAVSVREYVEYDVTSYYGPMNSQRFRGTVYYKLVYEVSSISGPFSLGGDSGALVVTNDGKKEKIVGMVIAGTRLKSLVLPFQDGLNELGLSIIRKHNTG